MSTPIQYKEKIIILHQWDKFSHKVGIDVKWKTHNVAKKHNEAIQCQQHENQNEYTIKS